MLISRFIIMDFKMESKFMDSIQTGNYICIIAYWVIFIGKHTYCKWHMPL